MQFNSGPMEPANPEQMLPKVRQCGQRLVAALTSAVPNEPWCDDQASYEVVSRSMSDAMDELAALELWGPENRLPSNELWGIVSDLLQRGDLLLHARTKPRGYAGDFEMLEKICSERLCADPLGRLLDRYFQAQHAPRAVRNRTGIVAERIATGCEHSSKSFHVVSIGSGPGLDIAWGGKQLPDRARSRLYATLVDLDPHALEYARQLLTDVILPGQLHCARENLYRIWRHEQVPSPFPRPDLVSCTGLFDYLATEDAARLLSCLWSWLSPGGRLLVFNFAPNNPTRAFMEWIGNWYLTYRSRADLVELAERANLQKDSYQVRVEAAGINLFLDAEKPRPG